MKKLAVFFVCICLIISAAAPVFAADNVKSWSKDTISGECERIEDIKNSLAEEFGVSETVSYPMHHITDDFFFKKVSLFNKFDKFISEEYDIITLDSDDANNFACHVSLCCGKTDEWVVRAGNVADYMPDLEGLEAFIENVDVDIAEGKFGKVDNVSLLFADYPGFQVDDTTTRNGIITIFMIFAYVKSDIGETLIPYTVLQTEGEKILEDGKSYTLKECMDVLESKLSASELTSIETSNVLYPWQTAVIAAAIAATLICAFFAVKKIAKRKVK